MGLPVTNFTDFDFPILILPPQLPPSNSTDDFWSVRIFATDRKRWGIAP